MSIAIEKSWKNVLEDEFSKPYFLELKEFLVREKQQFTVYPKGSEIFSAFNHTPFDQVKVVIIGQDPYHGAGQANGLSFSVSPGIAKPPSLVNIFKELESDLGIPVPKTGNLEPWANQGVLLLNATLTVRAGVAGSHQKKGWELFTDTVIQKISELKENVVFLLWGNFAQGKAELIDSNKHHILKAAHPSPLARGAFFGSRHFSKTNAFLESKGLKPIDWRVE
ncbi:MAG: uracil-DNA glycosylase [Crocinitomicaceae bacterium]|jgi:uracil-DNA glycosylase|nr:uracil-DNA glycosylase [Crocinitomicaceae bacterium]